VSAWKAAPIEVETQYSRRTVRGYISDDAPGLAVVPAVGYDGLWTLTHVPSGQGLGPGSEDVENVIGLALEMAALGDWTRDRQAINADKQFGNAALTILVRALQSDEYRDIERPFRNGTWADTREIARGRVPVGVP